MGFDVLQLFVKGFDDNFSYIIYHNESGETALVDPCGNVNTIKEAYDKLDKPEPKYILLTHGHRDHVSGVATVKEFFEAPVAAHDKCMFEHDIDLSDRQKLDFGDGFIETFFTPGHTFDSVTYRLSDDSAIFTGDTLFIDWCGFCKPQQMFDTMRNILYNIADSNIVYSGHNYGRVPYATLGEEKKKNPYLYTTDYNEFCVKLRDL